MDGIPEFERFFRSVAGLDVDKGDVYRLLTYVDEKVDTMAIEGRDAAVSNGRVVIAPQDLPITAGLHDQMREFAALDMADELRKVRRGTVRRPPGDVTFAADTEDVLVEVFCGIGLALARSFRILDPDLTHPSTEHWSRVFALYRLVL